MLLNLRAPQQPTCQPSQCCNTARLPRAETAGDRTHTQHLDITASPQHRRWTCRHSCLGMGAAFQHPCWPHQGRPAWYARITPVPARNEGERTSARPARSLRLLRIPGMCRKRSRTHPGGRLRALHPRMLRGARLPAAGLSIHIDQQIEPRQAQSALINTSPSPLSL